MKPPTFKLPLVAAIFANVFGASGFLEGLPSISGKSRVRSWQHSGERVLRAVAKRNRRSVRNVRNLLNQDRGAYDNRVVKLRHGLA